MFARDLNHNAWNSSEQNVAAYVAGVLSLCSTQSKSEGTKASYAEAHEMPAPCQDG